MKQWTQEKIREATESFYAQHHRYPKASEYHSGNGLPSYSTIRIVMQMTAAEYLRTFFPQDPQTDKALWSQESILQAIQQFLQINGTLPKYYDFYSENGLPSSATVHKIFPGESISTLYKRYFPEEVQSLHQVKHWTEATIIQALDEFSKRTGRLPDFTEMKSCNNLPSMQSIKKVFGHYRLSDIYHQYFEQSESLLRSKWTQQTVLEAIQSYHERNGKFPSSAEFNRQNQLPNFGTVRRLFHGMTFRDLREKYFTVDTPEAEDMETDENFGLSMGGM